MSESGFASGLGQTSSQNPSLSRRSFLMGLTALLALGLPEGACAAADFAPFSFAFISDVHLCNGMPDNIALLQESQLFLQDVVKQLNMRKLDFVIFGGDQVEGPGKDGAFWNLFIDVLQVSNAPWYFVLGESDVSGRASVDKMVEYGPDFKGRGLTSGKPYWSADPVANVHLVGLDTSKPNTSTGDLSVGQLNWLKSDLAANRGKFTMAVSHHPLLAPPPYDGGPPWDDYMVLQGASAREILGSSKDVRLCVSGHVPINKVQQEGGVWYVSAATLAMYPCQFKVFSVSPQAIHVETLQISYDALVKKAKKIMETSRLAFQYSSTKPQTFLKLAEGEELDRNALLPLVSGAVSQQGEKKKGKGRGKKEKPDKAEKAERPHKGKDKKAKHGQPSEEGPDQTTNPTTNPTKDQSKDQPGDQSKDQVQDLPKDQAKNQPKDQGKDQGKNPQKDQAKDQVQDQPKDQPKDDLKAKVNPSKQTNQPEATADKDKDQGATTTTPAPAQSGKSDTTSK